MENNNYQISKWDSIWNKIIYGWDLNLINTDYNLMLDVSHWQYDSNKFDKEKFKDKAKELNLKALIFKVSDANKSTGEQFYDTSADFWYKLGKECGLYVGGYHWLQSSVDPKTAFDFYNTWIKDHPTEFPAIIDFEEPSCVTKSTDYLWRCKTFVQLSGSDSIIYSGMGYINTLKQNIGSNYDKYMSWLQNYSFWLARYSRYAPKDLYPWKDWTIWQYSDRADFPFYLDSDSETGLNWGMPGTGLDMSWIKRSYLVSLGEQPPQQDNSNDNPTTPEQPTGEQNSSNALTFINNKTTMNVRNKPSISGTVVGSLPQNSEVNVLNIGGRDCWIEIEDGRWIAKQYGDVDYLSKKGE